MSNINHSVLGRLDKLVQWTGIPRLVERQVRRRRMRYLPIATLLLGTLSFAVVLFFPAQYGFGYAGLILSFGVGQVFPLFGPVKRPGDPTEEVDERERTLRRDAYLVTFATISAVAFLGVWMLVGVGLASTDHGALIRAMAALGFYLLTLVSTVPTLYASWALAELADGDE